MLLLTAFALVAGAATAASPCALPILPVVLAAGTTGGRRRPLGMAAGLVVAFVFATVALVYVIDAFGLPDDTLRILAIVVLATFGAALAVPALAARVEVAISRLGLARAARLRDGDGFGPGFVIGLGLGAVYAPCAGPILAGVITVSASQSLTLDRLVIAAAYGLGAAIVLFALALGARRLTRGLRRVGGWLQPAMGALMMIVAVLMAFELDIRFQTALADNLPAAIVNPSKALETSDGIQDDLAVLRGEDAVASAAARRATRQANRLLEAGKPLPDGEPAPPLDGGGRWFNSEPLALDDLRGRVVLLDFWTYSCINCVRTFPHLRSLDERYRSSGLTIVGVHTPEFPFERDAANVQDAIERSELRYPVVQDNDARIWDAYGASAWPTTVLIDAQGDIRRVHVGEGDYELGERAVRSLLVEAGTLRPGQREAATVTGPGERDQTPELYLGEEKGFYLSGRPVPGVSRYPGPAEPLPADVPALGGRWRTERDVITAVSDATVDLAFRAKNVFVVAGGEGELGVALDGEAREAVPLDGERLYPLVELPAHGEHRLTLTVPAGVRLYSFTFG